MFRRAAYQRAALAAIFVTMPVGAAMAAQETVLHAFGGGDDGNSPNAGVTLGKNGTLYGTTVFGGASGMGVVYQLVNSDGTWTEKVLHAFAGGTDGTYPYGGVIVDGRGNLYGGTRLGGSTGCSGGGCGVVYELSPNPDGAWRETILYAFPDSLFGEGGTLANLTFDSRHNLYGTTTGGGHCGYGNVFELKHADGRWKARSLHDFCGEDGQAPAYGALVFDQAGNLYGTTGFGGTGGVGVVFQLSPQAKGQWNFTVIHDFSQQEGGVADGGLTIDSGGNLLYGAEALGGPNSTGAIYEFSPSGGQWTETILYTFAGSPDGQLPFQNPVFDASGNLIGTTYAGGHTANCSGCGVIYKLAPQGGGQWSESVVYDFAKQSGGTDGYQPVAGLTRNPKGNFYGTTTKGGAVTGKRPCDCGAVFEFKP